MRHYVIFKAVAAASCRCVKLSAGRRARMAQGNDVRAVVEHKQRQIVTHGQEHAMPSSGTWKGYLKLSLVTCPVAMMPATSESERVRFHTLNRVTGNRVR